MIGSARWSAGRRPRRLQIDEICDAAREFLDSKRLLGLEASYLPAGLQVHVSPGDLESLRPFETQLRASLQVVVDGLARRPGVHKSADGLFLELVAEPGREEGAPPSLVVGYPRGEQVAHWTASDAGSRAGAAVLELVFTSDSSSQTSVQERRQLVLDGDPAEMQQFGGKGQRLAIANPFPRRPVGGARCPSALEKLELVAHALKSPAASAPTLWSEDGAVLIGRDAAFAHLVPGDAPSVMSRKHCALVGGQEGDLHLIDLGSSNGTRLHGRLCDPFKPCRLALPAAIEIGARGRLLLQVQQL